MLLNLVFHSNIEMDSPEEKIALGSVIHNSENDSKGGNIPMEEKYAQDMTSARITRSYVKMISQSVNSNSTDIKFRKKIKLSNGKITYFNYLSIFLITFVIII